MLICVRNRCAHWSLRLTPGTVDYMSNLSTNSRHFLRAAARKQDQSKAQRLFLVSQAREDAKTAKEKRAAAEKRKKRAADRIAMLNKFKPILSLKKLKSMTIGGDKGPRIVKQLTWHWRIGGDVNIPKGFHSFHKAKAWAIMVQAVWRHLHGVAKQKIEGTCMMYFQVN